MSQIYSCSNKKSLHISESRVFCLPNTTSKEALRKEIVFDFAGTVSHCTVYANSTWREMFYF